MKKYLILVLILIVAIAYYILNTHTLFFTYYNPYTATKPFPYISKTLKELDKAFDYAKFSSKAENKDFEYEYFNAYGSGFIQNNSIPNDLDFELGINLGEYEYDGKNKEEIAKFIMDKINSFEYSLNFYINTSKHFKTTNLPFAQLSGMNKQYKNNVKNIVDDLDMALSGKNYIKHCYKETKEDDGNIVNVDIPYMMKPRSILLENRNVILLFSNLINYNNTMKTYLRELSIIPEYFITIKQNEKKTVIKISHESFVGKRIQPDRKFFAPSVYTHMKSVNYLKGHQTLIDSEKYLHNRQLTYYSIIQEIPYIEKNNYVKYAKRIVQLLDIAQPLFDDNFYNESKNYISEILNNNDIRLLNEYINICDNINKFVKYPQLFFNMQKSGELNKIFNILIDLEEQAIKEQKVNKSTIDFMQNFRKEKLNILLSIQKDNELNEYIENIVDKYYEEFKNTLDNNIYELIKNPDYMKEIVGKLNEVLKDFGYNKVTCIYLGGNNIAFIENDFTKTIKNFDKLIKENDFDGIQPSVIKQSEIPELKTIEIIHVKYLATDKEQAIYETVKNKFLEDKHNFKLKYKLAWSL